MLFFKKCFKFQTLEACVKNCGRYFHQEVGKFRFLNEIIKVVSPKVCHFHITLIVFLCADIILCLSFIIFLVFLLQYLGNRTSEKVKKKCIEILYSWYKGLTHEPKIGEAYKMLKAQGIIKDDPTYMDKVCL